MDGDYTNDKCQKKDQVGHLLGIASTTLLPYTLNDGVP